MISGVISNLTPVVALLIEDGEGRPQRFHVALDTGFSSSLTLPLADIRRLGLTFSEQTLVTLASEEQIACNSYLATVRWQEDRRQVEVLELGSRPLMGMALLDGSKVAFEAREGGPVTIEPLL